MKTNKKIKYILILISLLLSNLGFSYIKIEEKKEELVELLIIKNLYSDVNNAFSFVDTLQSKEVDELKNILALTIEDDDVVELSPPIFTDDVMLDQPYAE